MAELLSWFYSIFQVSKNVLSCQKKTERCKKKFKIEKKCEQNFWWIGEKYANSEKEFDTAYVGLPPGLQIFEFWWSKNFVVILYSSSFTSSNIFFNISNSTIVYL